MPVKPADESHRTEIPRAEKPQKAPEIKKTYDITPQPMCIFLRSRIPAETGKTYCGSLLCIGGAESLPG
jgi:hypothetical protein